MRCMQACTETNLIPAGTSTEQNVDLLLLRVAICFSRHRKAPQVHINQLNLNIKHFDTPVDTRPDRCKEEIYQNLKSRPVVDSNLTDF